MPRSGAVARARAAWIPVDIKPKFPGGVYYENRSDSRSIVLVNEIQYLATLLTGRAACAGDACWVPAHFQDRASLV